MIKFSALSALLKQAVAQGTHDSRYCLINVGGVLSNWFCDSQRKEIEVFGNWEWNSNIIIATNIYSYIICLKGKPTWKLGMMKVHLNALSEFINKALEPYKELLMPKEE